MARRNSGGRPRSGASGRLRIVAGKWGGRYIQFKNAAGLRPTGERIRETLFNWLQPEIVGARVLDMFAGSGALGFEAASRGADHVDMVEYHAPTAHQLAEQLRLLGEGPIDLHQCSALSYLRNASVRYDIVFVDPPFHGTLMEQSLEELEKQQVLFEGAVVYLEFERQNPPVLPENWQFERLKEASDVGYGLIRVSSPS